MSLSQVAAVGLTLLVGAQVAAGPRYAVAPQPGLACMSLNMTEQQAMDPSFVVPLREEPSQGSAVVGQAGSIVLVRSPLERKDGFLSAVLFNGRPGWISADAVKPWQSPSGGWHECVPSRMSDGSFGFAFK